MSDFISVWLVPSVDTCTPLQQMVDTLADLYAAQTFIPHVTLLSGVASVQRVIELCKMIEAPAGLLSGRLTETFRGTGAVFHHSLGYNFAYDRTTQSALSAYAARFQQALAEQPNSAMGCANLTMPPQTHLSMLYLNEAPALSSVDYLERQRAALPRQGQHVVFDRLMVIRGDGPIQCQADVAAWAPVHTQTLATEAVNPGHFANTVAPWMASPEQKAVNLAAQ